MTKSDAASESKLEPFEISLTRRIRLSPVATFAVVGLVALLTLLGSYSASGIVLVNGSGETGWSLAPQAHASLLASLLLGYFVGATKYMTQTAVVWSLQDVANSRWSGAVGVLAGLIVSAITIADISALEPDRPLLNAGEALLNIIFLSLFWAIGRAGYFAIIAMLRPATIATVDLLDLGSLYGHGRDHLRLASVWLIGVSLLVFVMLFDPNPAVQVDSIKVIGPVLVGFVLLAIAMVLLPLRRIWLSIRTAKINALASVMAELRALRAMPYPPLGREADLHARRDFIAGLSEWPFDPTNVGSFAFYVLLPFLTWAAGTFAKKFFDTVFMEKIIRMTLGTIFG